MEELLAMARIDSALCCNTVLTPPWSLRFVDRMPLRLVAMTAGDSWVVPADDVPVRLRAGDVALVRGDEPFTLADDPTTGPELTVHPGELWIDRDGTDVTKEATLAVRTCGYTMNGSTQLITGPYRFEGAVAWRLLESLPTVVTVPATDIGPALLDLIRVEIDVDRPGQTVILHRLMDVLLVAILREWFSRPDSGHPSWFRAMADPMVGPAMRLMHDNLGYGWTVAALADRVAVSRAAFARRFREVVGEPPMSYLAGWRVCVAADQLRGTDDTVDTIARRVGYTSAFTLSVAFKRHYGVNPTEYRRTPLLVPA